jgi:hypothetical protein
MVIYTSAVSRLEIMKDAVAERITEDMSIVPDDEKAARELYSEALPSGAI